MSQTNNTPTEQQLKMWRVLDEIDFDPGIGRLTLTQQEALVEKFFSKEVQAQRLERIRKRKQALELEERTCNSYGKTIGTKLQSIKTF